MRWWLAAEIPFLTVGIWRHIPHGAVAAAWAAAAGTTGAVAIAIALAILDRRRIRRERYETSGAFLAGLLAPAMLVVSDIARVRGAIMHLGALRTGEAANVVIQAMNASKLRHPPALSWALQKMHEFDNGVVRAMRSALIALESYNYMIDTAVLGTTEKPASWDAGARDRLLPLLKKTIQETDELFFRATGSRS